MILVRGDRAHHDVGVAAEIFGAGHDRQIDAVFERAEKHRRRPGVVEQHGYAPRVRRVGDGGDVLHLEGQRARALAIDRARVRLEQARDAGADQGIVVLRLDTEALERLVAEMPRRPIAAVGHQQMIAGTADREDGRRDRVQSRRHGDATRAAFEFLDRAFEAAARRRTAPSVFVWKLLPFERLQAWMQDRRGAVDGRVDGTKMLGGHAPGRNRDRLRFLGNVLRAHGYS